MSLTEQFSELVQQHLHDDVQQLALQRNRFPQLTDADFRFLLQQVEGYQRTCDKLPTLSALPDWWFPVRLSCEQCSSEATARYKAQIISPSTLDLKPSTLDLKPSTFATLIDLTAGYGIDTFHLAECAREAHYVERNAELCRIAEHNFQLYRPHIQVHNTTAESFLASLPHHPLAQRPLPNTQYPLPNSAASNSPSGRPLPNSAASNTLIYLDPARRSQSGGKVFRIEDCEPNVIELLPTLRMHADRILIKFSPMLDITAALRVLGMDWDTHIVAVNNEVKEVLFLTGKGVIHAVNIRTREMRTDRFCFRPEDEKQAPLRLAPAIQQYIYEPNAAIIKAGAYRLIAEQYELQKLDTNTHLYTSDTYISGFPGRVWQVIDAEIKEPKKQLDKSVRYSILSRNYPLSPDEIRKKYKLRDGDEQYLIAARHQGKPLLIGAKRMR
jgi:16S rRNA G966 N2-methylase RsmD